MNGELRTLIRLWQWETGDFFQFFSKKKRSYLSMLIGNRSTEPQPSHVGRMATVASVKWKKRCVRKRRSYRPGRGCRARRWNRPSCAPRSGRFARALPVCSPRRGTAGTADCPTFAPGISMAKTSASSL